MAQILAVDRAEHEGKELKGNSRDFRTIGLGSQILADLGVQKMIVMSSPKRYHAISGFGLEIVGYMTN